MKLYKHQKKQNKKVTKALGKKNHVISGGATGIGKSVMLWDLINRDLKANKRVLVLAPYRKLIFQLEQTFTNHQPHVVMGTIDRGNKSSGLILSSMDTINNRLKKGESYFNNVDKVYIDECFKGDTEILTEFGWCRFDMLQNNVKVAQTDLNGNMQFVYPTRVIKKIYKGKLVTHSGNDGKGFSITATENHRQPIIMKNEKTLLFKELPRTFKIPSSLGVPKENIKVKNFLTLEQRQLICYQADGSDHKGQRGLFSFSKERKLKRFYKIFPKVDRNEVVCQNPNVSGNIKDRLRFTAIVKNKSKKLSESFNIKDFSKKSAYAFIKEVICWDGHKHSKTSWYYSCVDKDNVDFVNAVSVIAGFGTYQTIQVDNRKESHQTIHRLFLNMRETYSFQKNVKTETYFDGDVYCVEVPSSYIIVKQNKRSFISGNCHISCDFPPAKTSRMSLLYNKYWEICQWVGFTATPIKANGYRLGGWDKVIYKYQTPDLIRMGYLANFNYYAPVDIDLSSMRTNTLGEYVAEDIEEVTNTPTAVSSVKKVWKKHGKNLKKVLIFASSIKHAELLQEAIAGSFVIHSKLSDKVQMKILEDFKNSTVGTLINVAMLTTGFDNPSVDMLMIARPIKSERLAIQCFGRVLRKYGNKVAEIYDMCSCYKNCGLPSDIRDFNKVKGKVKPQDIEAVENVMKCDLCGEVSPRNEFSMKRKTKKKFIITKYTCPACGKMCKENRQDLTTIDKLEKVKVVVIKKLSYKERKLEVIKFIEEFTSAKATWSHFIVKSIDDADKGQLFDQIIVKDVTDRTKWKNILKLYEDANNEKG